MIGDMPTDGWIDRILPEAWRPYCKLMRLDRPIGVWLLLFPCWWSTTLAAAVEDVGPLEWLSLIVLFGIGATVMRGAGCVINDIFDRDIDRQVARTAARPLASGALSLRQAAVFLVALLLIGLLVLLSLSKMAVLVGIGSVPMFAVYPLMKRITHWPQAWLGLTFNWGALVGWAAITGTVGLPALLLFVGGLFWTLGYDTIYAHQDREDDLAVGVKSSALALGRHTRAVVGVFYLLAWGLFTAAGALAGLHLGFYLVMLAALGHFVWQVLVLDIDHGPTCLRLFKSNKTFGWIMLLAIVAGQV
ncbi:4-hydroxybenzoate octaprenyltransferase [Novispirillum itersonii subsp. nipponicum]